MADHHYLRRHQPERLPRPPRPSWPEWIRGHWGIEALHYIRNVTYGEDSSQTRTGS